MSRKSRSLPPVTLICFHVFPLLIERRTTPFEPEAHMTYWDSKLLGRRSLTPLDLTLTPRKFVSSPLVWTVHQSSQPKRLGTAKNVRTMATISVRVRTVKL